PPRAASSGRPLAPRAVLRVRAAAVKIVGTENDPPLPLRMPGNDEISHFDRLAPALLAGGEFLQAHFSAVRLEVLAEQLLFLRHSFPAADARADLSDLFEVAHRPLGVERSLGRFGHGEPAYC